AAAGGRRQGADGREVVAAAAVLNQIGRASSPADQSQSADGARRPIHGGRAPKEAKPVTAAPARGQPTVTSSCERQRHSLRNPRKTDRSARRRRSPPPLSASRTRRSRSGMAVANSFAI